MPTGSTLPVRLCLRSLTKVSVIAVTLSMRPLSQSAVSMQWASRSPVTPLPATLDVEPPEPVAALRQVGRDRPVLQELRAVVEDLAEPALVDELLGQRDGRHAAVVVPDHVRHAGLLDRRRPSSPPRPRSASGFSHRTILPACGRGDGDLGVRVVGRGDVDQVDVLALDELAPVGLDRLVAPVLGERLRPSPRRGRRRP